MKQALVTFILCFAQCLAAESSPSNNPQDGTPKNGTPEAMLQAFIRALDDLEWDRFRTFFADDASVFYPRGFTKRATGRPEFEANFRKVFEQIRAGRRQPPYMDLQPRDLQIQRYRDIAIATFHLDDRPGVLNRRTIVLRRRKGQWKIVHLHASETALSP
jgi:ketosteroid isomerase-like protein